MEGCGLAFQSKTTTTTTTSDTILKRVNLALTWMLCSIEIWMDSTTVLDWVGSVITDEKRV